MSTHTESSSSRLMWAHHDQELDLDGRGCDLRESLRDVLRARMVTGWRQDAACAGTDPEAWFDASSTSSESVPLSKLARLCAGCPVRRSCLASALANADEGIWAGTTDATTVDATWLLMAGAEVDVTLDEQLEVAAQGAGMPGQSAEGRAA